VSVRGKGGEVICHAETEQVKVDRVLEQAREEASAEEYQEGQAEEEEWAVMQQDPAESASALPVKQGFPISQAFPVFRWTVPSAGLKW
jgi:hypothetical protein